MPTLRRPNSNPGTGSSTLLRSSLASAAWAVEDRVVGGAGDVLQALIEVVRWPFERIAWAVEHWLIWPVQEETALWSRPVRIGVLAATILLAAAGVAAGIIVSDPSGGDNRAPGPSVRVAAPISGATAVVPTSEPGKAAAASAATVLQGSNPDFAPEGGGGVPKADAAIEAQAAQTAGSTSAAGADTQSAAAAAGTTGSSAGSAPASGSEVAGPAAIKVARRFAGAFALYETGRDNAKLRAILRETATPDLTRALLKRPPRLPANVRVPQAKVLNVVAGPKHGGTYILSVSLLRVGVTSELRLDMAKTSPAGGGSQSSDPGAEGKKPEWKVTDILG